MAGYYDPSAAANLYSQYGTLAAGNAGKMRGETAMMLQQAAQAAIARHQQNAQFIAQLNAERMAQQQRLQQSQAEMLTGQLGDMARLGVGSREAEAERGLRRDLAGQRQTFETSEGAADRANRLQTAMIGASGRRESAFDPLSQAKEALSRKIAGVATPEDDRMLSVAAPWMGGLSGKEQEAMNTTDAGRAVAQLTESLMDEQSQLLTSKKASPGALKNVRAKVIQAYGQYWGGLNETERREILTIFRPAGVTEADFAPGADVPMVPPGLMDQFMGMFGPEQQQQPAMPGDFRVPITGYGVPASQPAPNDWMMLPPPTTQPENPFGSMRMRY